MPCISSVFTLQPSCKPRMGGIRSIIWGLRAEIDSPFTEIAGPPGGDYRIELNARDGVARRIRGRGSFQSSAQINEETGQTYFRDELVFQPEKASMDDMLLFIDTLSRAGDDDLIIIVEDYTGCSWLMGLGINADDTIGSYPVFLTAAPVGTGTELGDLNGGSVTLASIHPRPAALANFNPDIV